MEAGTTIKLTNREARQALEALTSLVKERGFTEVDTITRVGRTIRRLRGVVEEAEDNQKILVQAHAKLDDDGKPVESGTSGVVLNTPRAFMDAIKELAKKTCEVEIWPVPAKVLNADASGKKCQRCKLITGLPEPEEYAVLLDLGFLTEAA